MTEKNDPTTTDTGQDLGQELVKLIGVTGGLQESMGGYRIMVYHSRGFPWDAVLKALVYRDFQVWVRRKKADLFIEAKP